MNRCSAFGVAVPAGTSASRIMAAAVVIVAGLLCAGCPATLREDPPGEAHVIAASVAPAYDQKHRQAGKEPAAAEPTFAAVLNQLASHFREVESFSVRSEIVLEMSGPRGISKVLNNRSITICRPNRFAFVGDDPTQLQVRSDGETMTTFPPAINQFTRAPAVSADDILRSPLGSVPGGPLGSFALHLAVSDPEQAILQGVVDADYAGTEELRGVSVHRLALRQRVSTAGGQVPANLTLWVETTQRPRLLQIQIAIDRADSEPETTRPASMVATERFSDWCLDPRLEDSCFEFVPPPGAREVKRLFEGMPSNAGGRAQFHSRPTPSAGGEVTNEAPAGPARP